MAQSFEQNSTYREMKRKPMSGFFAALFALQVSRRLVQFVTRSVLAPIYPSTRIPDGEQKIRHFFRPIRNKSCQGSDFSNVAEYARHHAHRLLLRCSACRKWWQHLPRPARALKLCVLIRRSASTWTCTALLPGPKAHGRRTIPPTSCGRFAALIVLPRAVLLPFPSPIRPLTFPARPAATLMGSLGSLLCTAFPWRSRYFS